MKYTDVHDFDDITSHSSGERGYEFWLLQEARARNPAIKTYALSWALPYWVGNQSGYYSDDEIAYHVKWMECTKQWNIGSIDYMGAWNERPVGSTDWAKKFKGAMEAAGFNDTKIVLPDGGGLPAAYLQDVSHGDAALGNAVAAIGEHYPCDRPDKTIFQSTPWKFWSSEDYSTVGDWAGAACWGRSLNQNFVRMNQTSTIAWSLIWSVYGNGFPYFGNGLMYAMTPWSGYYEAGDIGGHSAALGTAGNGAAIWTNAHVCQFVEVGWKYVAVGAGSGMLADLPSGGGGGSYTTLVSPDSKHFTVVIEKLEGRCLRCAGQTTHDEEVAVTLSGGLEDASSKLQVWSTNETHHFVFLGNITAVAGKFSVHVGRDSIVTVSNWFNGQAKAVLQTDIPDNTPFPTSHADDFETYAVDQGARFFADNGGSFQAARAPEASGVRVTNSPHPLRFWLTREH